MDRGRAQQRQEARKFTRPDGSVASMSLSSALSRPRESLRRPPSGLGGAYSRDGDTRRRQRAPDIITYENMRSTLSTPLFDRASTPSTAAPTTPAATSSTNFDGPVTFVVSNIDMQARAGDLEEMLGKYGVQSVRIVHDANGRSRGTAYVTFESYPAELFSARNPLRHQLTIEPVRNGVDAMPEEFLTPLPFGDDWHCFDVQSIAIGSFISPDTIYAPYLLDKDTSIVLEA